MNKDLPVIAEPSIVSLISLAVEKGAGIETIERLAALKERHDKQQAEIAFNEAMVTFQENCPKIIGTRPGSKTNAGVVTFYYAPLDQIEGFIKEPCCQAGLTYCWNSLLSEDGKKRSTTCTLTHVEGHNKKATFESSIDQGTNLMNNLQKEGSTLEYGRRNSLKLVLGLIVSGEDDDGNGTTEVQMNEKQIKELEKGVGGHKKLRQLILTAYNVTDLKYIPVEKYEECRSRISTYIDNLSEEEGR